MTEQSLPARECALEPHCGASTFMLKRRYYRQKDRLRDRFFNPYRTAKSVSAVRLVAEVTDDVDNHQFTLRVRRRRQSAQRVFQRSVDALVSDLAATQLAGPGQWTAITRSKATLGARSRYQSAVMNDALPAVMDHMEALGWIEMRKVQYVPHLRGRSTTIRAAARLVHRVAALGLSLEDFRMDGTEEVIILAVPHSKFLKGDYEADQMDRVARRYRNYQDDETTRRYRADMQRINAWLAEAQLDYCGDTEVDLSNRTLRRMFTESFSRGGRLYGGFWQSMKSEDREDIVIDEAEVVEVDYGQMALRIVYALNGLQYPLDRDAYAVEGFSKRDRKGLKRVVNAMLYSSKPLSRFPRGTRDLLSISASLSAVITAIENAHESIAHCFNVGVGTEVMLKESNIIVDVLLQLMNHGVVALPIHDAVVVPMHHLKLTKHVMLDVFKEHLGVLPSVRSE